MNVMKDVYDLNKWKNFLEILEEAKPISRDRKAIKTAKSILAGKMKITTDFPFPHYKQIKEHRNDKPREVYYYAEPYQTILKFINWEVSHCLDYLHQFSAGAVGYIPGLPIRRSIHFVKRLFANNVSYYFKTDFTNFFNSIPVNSLLSKLAHFFEEDPELFQFFSALLINNKVNTTEGVKEISTKGAMAGLPLAGLWANIYMTDIDVEFYGSGVHYLRYADDVLMLSNDKNYLIEEVERFKNRIQENGLKLSQKKTWFGQDEVVFLGFKINAQEIRVCDKALQKIKSSLFRRRQWFSYQVDHGKFNSSRALYLYLKGVNGKLFSRESEDRTDWTKWYAGVVTGDEDFKLLEIYLLKQCMQMPGRYKYSDFVKAGYRSPVREFYKLKEEKNVKNKKVECPESFDENFAQNYE